MSPEQNFRLSQPGISEGSVDNGTKSDVFNFNSANLPELEMGANFEAYGVVLRSTISALSLNDLRRVENGEHSLSLGFSYDYKFLNTFFRFDNYSGFYSDISDSPIKKSRDDIESKNFSLGCFSYVPILSSNPNAIFVSESSEVEISTELGLGIYYLELNGQEPLSSDQMLHQFNQWGYEVHYFNLNFLAPSKNIFQFRKYGI